MIMIRPSILWPLALILLLLAGEAAAGNLYVAPRTTVWLRSGGGVEYKILARLKVGEQVEILEESGGWAHITTADGKDGWVLKRYLSPEPPPALRLKELEERCGTIQQQYQTLRQQKQDAQSALEGCKGQLAQCTRERDQVAQELSLLKKDSADVVKTKELLASTTQEMDELKRQVVALKKENAALKNGERLKWFLAGGGVLLLGWLAGLASSRGRRRRSTLL